MEEEPEDQAYSARGSLSRYANPDMIKEEGSAWEKAVVEKFLQKLYMY